MWKARNEEVFDSIAFSTVKVCRQAAVYATDMHINIFNDFIVDPVNGSWCKSPPGYMKLSVDGSFYDRQGTFGGLLRDDQGKWMWGFTGKSNANDPLHAELQCLRVGLQVLIDKGCNSHY